MRLGSGQYLWEYGMGKFATGPPVIFSLNKTAPPVISRVGTALRAMDYIKTFVIEIRGHGKYLPRGNYFYSNKDLNVT